MMARERILGPCVLEGFVRPRADVGRTQVNRRTSKVDRGFGQQGKHAFDEQHRGVHGLLHPLGLEGGERGSDGGHAIQSCFTGSPHRAAVVGVLAQVWPKVDAGDDQTRHNLRGDVRQTTVQRDDHRVAWRAVQLEQANWSVAGQAPCLHQIHTFPQRHG